MSLNELVASALTLGRPTGKKRHFNQTKSYYFDQIKNKSIYFDLILGNITRVLVSSCEHVLKMHYASVATRD